MAAWDKDVILITLRNSTTGELDKATHTVEVQPTTSAYPTNKVACSQLPNLASYKPDSDLDDETHYWVYVDTVKTYKLIAHKSEPNIGL
ncbi:MAG: hypothetical protein PHX83_12005 [Acidobacteriia bacterium]|nr:hypothetical protein [Terriglobia bacterium]